MTQEQSAQRALTGKVEVFVGDKHTLYFDSKERTIRVTRITRDRIYYKYSWKHIKDHCPWVENEMDISTFTFKLRGYLQERERYAPRECVVLDLSEPESKQAQGSLFGAQIGLVTHPAQQTFRQQYQNQIQNQLHQMQQAHQALQNAKNSQGGLLGGPKA